MSDVSRRELLVLTVAAACTCAAGGMVLAAPAKRGKNDIGPLADYASAGIKDTFAQKDGFFVISDGNRVYASSATCTHKKSTLKLKSGQIVCTSHNSRFDNEGKATKGPATKPLERFEITQDDNGHLIVDTSKSFKQEQWNEPGSFIAVK